jgi:hypothetical protein
MLVIPIVEYARRGSVGLLNRFRLEEVMDRSGLFVVIDVPGFPEKRRSAG